MEIDGNATPPKFNSEFTPEKRWLEDEYFPIGKVIFQGRTVKLLVTRFKTRVTFHYTGWLIGILMSWFIIVPI